MKTMETDRFRLRLLEAGDEKLLLDLDSDPAVMKWINGGVPSTHPEVLAAVGRVLGVVHLSHGTLGVWQAFDKVSNDYVGWVLFRPDKKDPTNVKTIEVGYRLKRGWWGRGVATELARRMLRYGFEELGVEEVFAVAMKGNLASQNVMKKLGMEFVHNYQEEQFPLENRDAVRYRMTAEAYAFRSPLG
jgi:RimJ/RimL family protein N-acetyltransferase